MKSIITRNDTIRKLKVDFEREIGEAVEAVNKAVTSSKTLPILVDVTVFSVVARADLEKQALAAGWRVTYVRDDENPDKQVWRLE